MDQIESVPAYSYDPDTGIYAGETVADRSPEDEGDLFLAPRYSTLIEPPENLAGKFRVFSEVLQEWAYEDIPVPSISSLRAGVALWVDIEREQRNFSTFTHAGKEFSCDRLARSDLDGAANYVGMFGALPPALVTLGAWKCTDGSTHAIPDVDAFKSLYASLVATGAANFIRAEEMKAEIAAAQTAQDLAAIAW